MLSCGFAARLVGNTEPSCTERLSTWWWRPDSSTTFVQRHHRLRARGELDLGHREEGAARAVPQVGRHRIVEVGSRVRAQPHAAAARLRVEAVAQQRNGHLGVGELRHQARVPLAETRQRDADEDRVHRRRLELVARRTVERMGVEEMVRIDRLWSAGVSVDATRHDRRRDQRRVQEGVPSEDAARIRRGAAQQDGGAADRARGEHEVARAHAHAALRRRHAVACDAMRIEVGHAAALEDELRDPGAVDQRRAAVERRRDRGDEHRLLGVHRAPEAAITEVQAALHVAANRAAGDAELLAAAAKQVVVRVGRDGPRRDR